MSLLPQNLVTNPRPRIFSYTHTQLKNPAFSFPLSYKPFKNLIHFQVSHTNFLNPRNSQPIFTRCWALRELESEGTTQRRSGGSGEFSFDAFLSVVEMLCLASSTVVSIGLAVNSVFPVSQNPAFGWFGNKFFVYQCVLLVGVLVGSLLRRRQWRRICVDFSNPGGSGSNLLGRIEKLEEDLRSSVTIVRTLSRQLEKLGIRFRVTRKALKDPIAETAALAQKNSETTRALAMQEAMLEKELAEIQKVLLAMQDQQQKQLELILAIGKAGRFWESKKEIKQDLNTTEASSSTVDGVPQMRMNEIPSRQKEANIDKA